MTHVALYLRISRDPAEQRAGVGRQDADCRRFAGELWPDLSVEVYCDNDLTAADPAVGRPEFDRMVSDIRAGDVAQVVAVEQSRLTRQPAEWEMLCLTLTLAGITHVHTLRSGTVAVAEENRLIGRIMAAVDAEEVERMKARTRRAHAQLAREGRPAGHAPFGYRNSVGLDGRPSLEVVDEAAAVIRRAADELLAGATMTAVCEGLNDDGIATPRNGKRWRISSLRCVMTTPTIAGLRAHQGQVAGPAIWPAILDRETWERVGRAMSTDTVVNAAGDTVRVTRSPGAKARSYLLTSGLSVCALCATPLLASRQARRGSTVKAYCCRSGRLRDGCGGVSVGAAELEAYVTDRVLAVLATTDLAEVLAERAGTSDAAELVAEITDAEGRLNAAAAMFAAGDLSAPEWSIVREAASARAERARARLSAATPDRVDLPADPAAEWETLTLAQRQYVIGLVAERVEVTRAIPGARRFDPERVRIVWRSTT